MPPGANPPMAKSRRGPIREDELIKTSPTFRNSQRNQKNQKKAEKKTAETT